MGTSSGVVVEVSLRLTYEDGASSPRVTYFVFEDGEWKHAFSQEEREELRKLRREVKVLCEEREILKEAAVGSTGERNGLGQCSSQGIVV